MSPNTTDSKLPVGVVGAGTMGSGIAQLAATAGHPVYLYDAYRSALDNARKDLGSILQRQVEKERMTSEQVQHILSRIHFVEDMTRFDEIGVVFEAVTEDLERKQDVFQRVEGIVSTDCLMATNTSSLSIASLSSVLKKPQRFLGAHFFNPAPVLPLVEIIPGIQTEQDQAEWMFRLMQQWDKSPVYAKDTPGFIVNRVARPFYSEALQIYEEGIANVTTIDWAMKQIGGFKMGPFELMDFIGNDVNYKVTCSVFEQFYYDPRFRPSLTQKRMVEAGLLGRKSGSGFYNYNDPSRNPDPNRDHELGEKIVQRIRAMIINEAADAVFKQIATVQGVDTAMKQGVRYPKGPLEWADELGVTQVFDLVQQLYNRYQEDRYRPNPLLKQLAEQNATFYEYQQAPAAHTTITG